MIQNINVTVHTSLPPSINKPDPYFYLNLHVIYIKWTSKIPSNYDDILVKVLWWGEENQGALFIPRCVNLAGYKQNVRTHAIYPVRVPINHFRTYLADMNNLYFDIIDKNKHYLIGRATVDNIEQLSNNKGLQSLCTIINEKNLKIGEMMVSMTLEPAQTNKKNDQTKPMSINEINEKREVPITQKNLDHSKESSNRQIELNFNDKDSKSENMIDKLIEQGKKIRETISIDVKNDEINNAILKTTFPNIRELKPDDNFINQMMIDDSINDLSFNDISKLHTESILKTSENFTQMRSNMLDNNRESIKLIAGSDSFCSDSGMELADKYRFLSHSETKLLKKLDKDLSSDDDPCKHDSIIEELFYKQIEPENDGLLKKEIQTNKDLSEATLNPHNTKIDQKPKDFEIYEHLSQKNNFRNNWKDNTNNDNHHPMNYDDQKLSYHHGDDRNWYKNISSIKVYLDILWLNSSPQISNKNIRSRSQSSNYSSDREKLRRSYDSGSSVNNSSTSFSGNKPPTPQIFQLNSSCKYYIEYKFPTNVSRNTGGEKENVSFSISPTRIAIKLTGSNYNLSDPSSVKSISLDHVNEFPVSFDDNSVIQKWWKGTVRFKLISLDMTKKETVIGIGAVPLRNIISTNNFYRLIPIRLPRNKFTKTNPRVVIGSLGIRTTMVISQNNYLSPSERKSEISFQSDPKSHTLHTLNNSYVPNKMDKSKSLSLSQHSTNKKNLQQMYSRLRNTSPLPITSTKIIPICLESLLCVTNIRYINPKLSPDHYKSGSESCNLYFIGRLLWATNKKITSRILWGTSKVADNQSVNELENFKLLEKSSIILTSEMLENFRNNYAILEIWDISTDRLKNALYGLVKIPLHIFHMSFKNEKIRNTVLNNVYPLLSCDDWINIQDPLTGKSKGQVHVLLAMGSPQQIEDLQLSKENTFNGHWNRNYLTNMVSNNELIEHSIELDIESLRNFHMDKFSVASMNDVYFYVQYFFPLQNNISDNNGKNWESAIFRSVNNPLQSSVDISDSNRHRFRLPTDCSLKAMLGKHFDGLGKKHILFELFIKQYNPFPRSISVAKGRLQVASLFQLINQHSVDMDSLADTVTQQQVPVLLLLDGSGDLSNPVGVLNVRLCYRTKLIENTYKQKSSGNASHYDQPIVRIEILSATGLQFAAETLVDRHPELQYSSITGVNASIKFWLTDEGNKQSRIYVNSKGIQKFQFHFTKTLPRTFTPRFDHVSEVLLGPIIDDESSDSLYKTLAEKIICGIYQLNIEIYHNVSNSPYCDFDHETTTSKILIGKGRISLADLLLRSSGFMGPLWLPVFCPSSPDNELGGCKLNRPSKNNLDSIYFIEKQKSVGAVEIRLGFIDKIDRQSILQLAMDAGYVVPWTNRLETEDLVWQQMDVHGFIFKYITVHIEEVELSEKLFNSIFTPGVGFKKSCVKILARYRMYKQAVSSSPNFLLNEDEFSGRVFIPINHEEKFCYRVSSDLFRYLRESKLEVQVWAIYGSLNTINTDYDYNQTENSNDVRLMGSALFDLSNLILPCDQPEKSVSHILPIWKRGVANCANSNVSITVSMCGAATPLAGYNSVNENNDYITNPSRNDSSLPRKIGHLQKSFPVHIIIEKAVNLKPVLVGNENSDVNDMISKSLNYFVSFACADDHMSINSSVVKGYREAVWNFECDTRLDYNLLSDEKLSMDFKIFYSNMNSNQTGEILDEKVLLGIVKLDLSLLLKGFERVIGWYNIIDLQGDCQGQIKVGVTPMIPLVPHSAVVSKNIINSKTAPVAVNKPFSLDDHQNYLTMVRMRLRGQADIENPTSIPFHENNSESVLDQDCQEIISKSSLFDTLKEKLKELDNMNETFKKKMETNPSTNQQSDRKCNFEIYPQPLISTLKVDYGTNTETDDRYNHNYGYNNNNYYVHDNNDENKSSVIYKENDIEDNEKIRSEMSDESIIEKYHHELTCINDIESSPQPVREMEDCMKMNPIRDNVCLENHDEIIVSNHESESDRYSTSSCEIDDPQSINVSGSMSSCDHHDEMNIKTDEIYINDQNSEMSEVDQNDKLNDSWDEAVFQASSKNCQNPSEPQVEETSYKVSNVPSIIPKFFPQSFNYHEKLKAVKQNIEINPTNIASLSQTVSNNNNNNNLQPKRNQTVNITDEEASRISKIFGIRKS